MLYTNYMREIIGLKDVIVTSVERKDNQLNISLKMERKSIDVHAAIAAPIRFMITEFRRLRTLHLLETTRFCIYGKDGMYVQIAKRGFMSRYPFSQGIIE